MPFFSGFRRVLSALVEKISTSELTEKKLEPIMNELLLELVACDIAFPIAEEIVDHLKKELIGAKVERSKAAIRKFVKEKLREVLLSLLESGGEIDLIKMIEEKRRRREPFVILFLGPNGHGKTTTIAKIAYLLLKKGYSVVLACSDTFRAGAREQLEEHAKRLGVKMIRHEYGADPAAVAYDAVMYARARGIDVVLIDTAGRMQTNVNLMEELNKIARVVEPDLKVFVGDALTGNDALEQAMKFNEYVGIDAIVLTKVDADAKGGAAITIVKSIRKPILFLGTGQRYEDLVPFNPRWIIDRLLE